LKSACKNYASREYEKAMQKVQIEEIVLRFLYKNTNSFNIIDKNVMLQPKIARSTFQ